MNRTRAIPGPPAWSLLFSDLAALLLALFVLLVSFSEIDPDRWPALRAAFPSLAGPGEELPLRRPPARRVDLDALEPWAAHHAAQLSVLGSATEGEEAIWVEFGPRASFAPGSAEPSGALQRALEELTSALPRPLARVEIGGHTSSAFVPDRDHPTAEELALDRARRAGALLLAGTASGVEVRWVAYGDAFPRPGVDPETLAGRSACRRITLLLRMVR